MKRERISEETGQIIDENYHSITAKIGGKTETIPKAIVNGEIGKLILVIHEITKNKVNNRKLEISYWRVEE